MLEVNLIPVAAAGTGLLGLTTIWGKLTLGQSKQWQALVHDYAVQYKELRNVVERKDTIIHDQTLIIEEMRQELKRNEAERSTYVAKIEILEKEVRRLKEQLDGHPNLSGK